MFARYPSTSLPYANERNLTHASNLNIPCCPIDMETKLGVGDSVYCVYDYEPENEDELQLCSGDELTILKRGDDFELDWWWARHGEQEGYVAKNLLAVRDPHNLVSSYLVTFLRSSSHALYQFHHVIEPLN